MAQPPLETLQIVTANRPPLMFTEPTYQGFLFDLITAMFQRANIDNEYNIYTLANVRRARASSPAA